MPYVRPASAATRRERSAAVAIAVLVSAAFASVAGDMLWPSWSSSAPIPTAAEAPASPLPEQVVGEVPVERSDDVGVAGGEVPDGVTVFDDAYPAVANLDSTMLATLREAATDASGTGIEFFVNSGWRSTEYQEQLLDNAVAKYGSREEAARWVATPNTSTHVSGDAVDIGPSDAQAWLSRNGAGYGLCQIYSNEPWHFELRPDAIAHGCPAMYADAAHDPRMQQ